MGYPLKSDRLLALYLCKSCDECAKKDVCIPNKKTKRGRTITRDEYESCRENVVKRMGTELGREIYKRRMPTVETVFGYFNIMLPDDETKK